MPSHSTIMVFRQADFLNLRLLFFSFFLSVPTTIILTLSFSLLPLLFLFTRFFCRKRRFQWNGKIPDKIEMYINPLNPLTARLIRLMDKSFINKLI